MEDTKKQEINDDTKQFLKKNYFNINKPKFPSWTARNIIIAYFAVGFGIFFMFYFESVITTFVVGTISILIGFIFFYRWMKPYYSQKSKFDKRPTDNQIENWLLQDIKKLIKPKAIEMLSIDENNIQDDNFIIVPHPIYWKMKMIDEEHITKVETSEGYYNYSAFKVQILALTDNYVSLFTCNYNSINNEFHAENTNEFFFDDISSIKNDLEHLSFKFIDMEEDDNNDEDNEENKNENEIGEARVFKLKNMSGESLSIITDIPSLESSPRISQKLDKIIQVLRLILRNRRYGETFEIIRPQEEEQSEEENKEYIN